MWRFGGVFKDVQFCFGNVSGEIGKTSRIYVQTHCPDFCIYDGVYFLYINQYILWKFVCTGQSDVYEAIAWFAIGCMFFRPALESVEQEAKLLLQPGMNRKWASISDWNLLVQGK